MEIRTIFAIKQFVLYSVAYDEEKNEFKRLFDLWTSDFEYLESFFEENKADLQNGFWGVMTVEQAIFKTRNSAIKLRKQFYDIANNSESTDDKLQQLFRPLRNDEYQLNSLSKEKSKEGWLRIYAIRISENTYVVSGGAIKLTQTMNNEGSHLLIELKKLELTKQFLIENGLTDESDFGFFEFIPE
ncbi:hypothetical protein ACWA1C_00275 [Flectobacillus roseus]